MPRGPILLDPWKPLCNKKGLRSKRRVFPFGKTLAPAASALVSQQRPTLLQHPRASFDSFCSSRIAMDHPCGSRSCSGSFSCFLYSDFWNSLCSLNCFILCLSANPCLSEEKVIICCNSSYSLISVFLVLEWMRSMMLGRSLVRSQIRPVHKASPGLYMLC